MTASRGGGSALSGCECSVCGSMARQLIVQPHFLHLPTQATGSPGLRSVITAMIGERKEKVILVAGPRFSRLFSLYGCEVNIAKGLVN